MEVPDALAGFMNIERMNATAGILDQKTKELISLAIAITMRSRGCMTMHIKNAMDSGASREEIIETIGVAIMLGGSPAVMSGCKAYEALKALSKRKKPALLYDR